MQSWALALFTLAGSIIFQSSLASEAHTPDDSPDPAQEGRGTLDGEWECLNWNYEGITSGVDFGPRAADPWLHPIIAGDSWSWRPAPKSPPVLYARLSPGDDCRTIDIATADRKGNILGIYDIEGDVLRICLSTNKPGASRPVDFAILPLDREVNLIYRRVGLNAADARQAEMTCLIDAISADSSMVGALARLSIAVSTGRVPVRAFEIGIPHCDSALLKRLRASIGVVPVKVVASATSLNERAMLHCERALEHRAELDRLHRECRAEVRAEMKKRMKAAPAPPQGHNP